MPALAQAQYDYINIKGFEIYCRNCKKISQETCSTEVKGRETSIACDNLLNKYFRTISPLKKNFSSATLLKNALSNKYSKANIELISKMLFSNEIELELSESYAQYVNKYREEIEGYIVNKFSSNNRKNLNALISHLRNSNLKPLLALSNSKNTFVEQDQLINSLEKESISADLKLAKSYLTILSKHQLKAPAALITIVKNLSICSNAESQPDCIKNFTNIEYFKSLHTNLVKTTVDHTEHKKLSVNNTKRLHPDNRKMIDIYAIAVFLLLLMLTIALLKIKIANRSAFKNSYELQKSLMFFNLPYWASLSDLKKKYRELIKNAHPDINQTCQTYDKFVQITQKYKRTKELMGMRKNNG